MGSVPSKQSRPQSLALPPQSTSQLEEQIASRAQGHAGRKAAQVIERQAGQDQAGGIDEIGRIGCG
jgi:hypothetical protein